MAKRQGKGAGKGKGWKNIIASDSYRHELARRGIKSAQRREEKIIERGERRDVLIGETDYYRNSDGKISDTRLSPYGRQQLRLSDGALLGFTDMTLEVKGDKLVNTETGKVEVVIDNDRMVNKIMFKIIGG